MLLQDINIYLDYKVVTRGLRVKVPNPFSILKHENHRKAISPTFAYVRWAVSPCKKFLSYMAM